MMVGNAIAIAPCFKNFLRVSVSFFMSSILSIPLRRRRVFQTRAVPLRQNLIHNMGRLDSGQAVVQALKAIGQLGVVNAH